MGLGYIGLPTAIIAAQHGIDVVGVDINPKVVDTVNQGRIHIVEPGLQELCRQVVSQGKLKASLHPETSDVYLIVVPTPFIKDGNHQPDISYVEAATRTVLPYLKEGDLFIIESTSPVGTTEKMAQLIYTERPELKDNIHIAYCPERVLPGNVIYELIHNDRVIGGIDAESTEKAIAFYRQFVKGELHKTNARTAEMCKLTENSSRDVQIAFANELSIIKLNISTHNRSIRPKTPTGKYPSTRQRCGRPLHSRRSLFHHGRFPDGIANHRQSARNKQLQSFLVRRKNTKRHKSLRGERTTRTRGCAHGVGLQTQHRRPEGIAGQIHCRQSDAGLQQCRFSDRGAQPVRSQGF